jgi:hypothetical protein
MEREESGDSQPMITGEGASRAVWAIPGPGVVNLHM